MQGSSKKQPSRPCVCPWLLGVITTINPPPVHYHELPPAYDPKSRDSA